MNVQLDDRRVDSVIAEKYRVDKLIAQGGFSSVYRGIQLGMDRPIAIKVLELDQEKGVAETWLKRFEREARLVSQLNNPNTITIYDFGRGADFLYIVMEYIRGRSLSRQIRKHGSLRPVDTAIIATAILGSLEEAHNMGVLHRDMKPSNIMLGRDYDDELLVKVLDFGVAKITEPSLEMGVQLTQAGTFVGTPRYASPEQMRREELTPASDIYGVGMIMWECLTGEPPVPSTDFPTCVAFHLGPDPWVLPPNVDCPGDLQMIVERALQKHHADRYQSCGDMLDDLRNFLNPDVDGKTQVDTGVPDAVQAYLTSQKDASASNSFEFPQAIAQSMDELSSPEIMSPNIDFDFAGSDFQPDAVFDPDAAPPPVAPSRKKKAKDPTPSFSKAPPEKLELETSLAPESKKSSGPTTTTTAERPKLARKKSSPLSKALALLAIVIMGLAAVGTGLMLAMDKEEKAAVTAPAKQKEAQPNLIPADALFLAMKTAKWNVGKITVDDLGDVQRHSTMVMKDNRVATVVVYECEDVAVAKALLEDTQTPEEAVLFGRTLIRIGKGPSSAKNGVQKLTAMLFTFRSMMEKEGKL